MSNLNPGGSRDTGPRAFTAGAVERAIDQARGTGKGGTSIADQPHQHSREVERRLRQEARRKAAKP